MRLGASGSIVMSTFSQFSPVDGHDIGMHEESFEQEKCYSAARLSQAKRHSAGALWYGEKEDVSQRLGIFIYILCGRAGQTLQRCINGLSVIH